MKTIIGRFNPIGPQKGICLTGTGTAATKRRKRERRGGMTTRRGLMQRAIPPTAQTSMIGRPRASWREGAASAGAALTERILHTAQNEPALRATCNLTVTQVHNLAFIML